MPKTIKGNAVVERLLNSLKREWSCQPPDGARQDSGLISAWRYCLCRTARSWTIQAPERTMEHSFSYQVHDYDSTHA